MAECHGIGPESAFERGTDAAIPEVATNTAPPEKRALCAVCAAPAGVMLAVVPTCVEHGRPDAVVEHLERVYGVLRRWLAAWEAVDLRHAVDRTEQQRRNREYMAANRELLLLAREVVRD